MNIRWSQGSAVFLAIWNLISGAPSVCKTGIVCFHYARPTGYTPAEKTKYVGLRNMETLIGIGALNRNRTMFKGSAKSSHYYILVQFGNNWIYKIPLTAQLKQLFKHFHRMLAYYGICSVRMISCHVVISSLYLHYFCLLFSLEAQQLWFHWQESSPDSLA